MDQATHQLAEKLAVIAYAAQEEIAPLVTKGEAAAEITADYLAEVRDALAELTHDLRAISRDLLKLEPPTAPLVPAQQLKAEITAALVQLIDDVTAAAEAVRDRSSQVARSDEVP